jgi:hypothetical protein
MLSAAVIAATDEGLGRARAELGLNIDTLDSPRLEDARSPASTVLVEG